MLQPGEQRCCSGNALVTDLRTVVECQAGEAPAVKRHGCQALITDLRQHGERQSLQVWKVHHLDRRRNPVKPFLAAEILLCSPQPNTHLSDAAVGDFGTGRQVELLEAPDGQQGRSHLLPERPQVLVRHQAGFLLEGQAGRLEEAHVAKSACEAWSFVLLIG